MCLGFNFSDKKNIIDKFSTLCSKQTNKQTNKQTKKAGKKKTPSNSFVLAMENTNYFRCQIYHNNFTENYHFAVLLRSLSR